MPIYEYEPTEHDCFLCPNRVAAIQGVDDPPLEFCPDCGLPVRRVISRVSFQTKKTPTAADAAKRGFTTWQRTQEGVWEKVDGPGVDAIVADEADLQAVKEESRPVIDLDVGD